MLQVLSPQKTRQDQDQCCRSPQQTRPRSVLLALKNASIRLNLEISSVCLVLETEAAIAWLRKHSETHASPICHFSLALRIKYDCSQRNKVTDRRRDKKNVCVMSSSLFENFGLFHYFSISLLYTQYSHIEHHSRRQIDGLRRRTANRCVSPHEKYIRCRCDLDLWPFGLKIYLISVSDCTELEYLWKSHKQSKSKVNSNSHRWIYIFNFIHHRNDRRNV